MNEYQLTNDYRRLANPKTRYANILYQGKFELGRERSPESLFLHGEKQSTHAVKITSNDSLRKQGITAGLTLTAVSVIGSLLGIIFGFTLAFILGLGLLGWALAKCGQSVIQRDFYPEAHRHGALRKLLEKDAEFVLHQEGERGFCYQLELETILSKMDRYADCPKPNTPVVTNITVGIKFILSSFLPKRRWKLSGPVFKVFHLQNFYLQGGQIYCSHLKTASVLDEWDTIWNLFPKQVTQ